MSRKLEIYLRRGLRILSFCIFCGAIILLVNTYVTPHGTWELFTGVQTNPKSIEPIRSNGIGVGSPAPITNNGPNNKSAAEKSDPKLERLATSRMTRTVVPRQVIVQKPVAPDLNTLIRVKGILDFGDPKSNEAVIETLRNNQTRNYRVGDTIPDINAVISKIDTAVTFEYDSKTLRIEIKSNDRTELSPIGSRTAKDTYTATAE